MPVLIISFQNAEINYKVVTNYYNLVTEASRLRRFLPFENHIDAGTSVTAGKRKTIYGN